MSDEVHVYASCKSYHHGTWLTLVVVVRLLSWLPGDIVFVGTYGKITKLYIAHCFRG